MAPFGERAVAIDLRVDEREIETRGSSKRDRFFEDALAAANVDLTRRSFGERDRGGERVGDLNAVAGERVVAGEDDGVAIVVEDAFPRLEADASENDRGARGLIFEETPIFGDAPRELAVAANHAILGAGDDEIERARHEDRLISTTDEHGWDTKAYP